MIIVGGEQANDFNSLQIPTVDLTSGERSEVRVSTLYMMTLMKKVHRSCFQGRYEGLVINLPGHWALKWFLPAGAVAQAVLQRQRPADHGYLAAVQAKSI